MTAAREVLMGARSRSTPTTRMMMRMPIRAVVMPVAADIPAKHGREKRRNEEICQRQAGDGMIEGVDEILGALLQALAPLALGGRVPRRQLGRRQGREPGQMLGE